MYDFAIVVKTNTENQSVKNKKTFPNQTPSYYLCSETIYSIVQVSPEFNNSSTE